MFGWFKKNKSTMSVAVASEFYTELQYLRARLRALSEYAYKTKKGEHYLIIQASDGKFRKVQIPEIK